MTNYVLWPQYTRHIPVIWHTLSYDRYMSGIWQVYDSVSYIRYIPSIYLTYDSDNGYIYTMHIPDIWQMTLVYRFHMTCLEIGRSGPQHNRAWNAAAHRVWIARVFIVQHTTRRCHWASRGRRPGPARTPADAGCKVVPPTSAAGVGLRRGRRRRRPASRGVVLRRRRRRPRQRWRGQATATMWHRQCRSERTVELQNKWLRRKPLGGTKMN